MRVACLRIFFFLALLLRFVRLASAGAEPESLQVLIDTGISRSLLPDYDSARVYFKKIITKHPEHPAGYFFTAALYHTMIIDYEDYRFEPQFREYADKARARVVQRRKKETRLFDEFLYGTLDGYEGLLYIKKGDWWSGFRAGLKGLNAMEAILETDSAYYDAWWCVGVYQFYRSKMTKVLWWLPFISDQREAGIAKLKVAIKKGKYSRIIARQSLIWILYEEKRFAEAIRLALELHRQYPENRMFLWAVADTYYELKDWDNSLSFYKKILEKSEGIPYDNHYNAVISRWKTARIHFFNQRYDATIAQCDTILGYTLDGEVKERLEEKLEQAGKLKKEAGAKRSK